MPELDFSPNIRVTARAAGTAIMPREFPRHDGFRVRATCPYRKPKTADRNRESADTRSR